MSSLDACPGNGREFNVYGLPPPRRTSIGAFHIGTFSNSPLQLKKSDSTNPVNDYDDTLGPQESQITLSYTLLPLEREDIATQSTKGDTLI